MLEKRDTQNPKLIIVPLSTIPGWTSAFENWTPDINIILYHSLPLARKQMIKDLSSAVSQGQGAHQVLITSYEIALRDNYYLRKFEWDVLIVDEGHRLKNQKAKLLQALNRIRCDFRVLLTGTPLQNNLRELFTLMNFVLPDLFDHTLDFEEWFSSPFSTESEVVSTNLTPEEEHIIIQRLHAILKPFVLRRTKNDVELNLPSKHEVFIPCMLSGSQKAIYMFIQEAARAQIENAKSFENTLIQLRKACNHPLLFMKDLDEDKASRLTLGDFVTASGKFWLLDYILPMLFSLGHRVLVFFQMTRVMDLFEDYLEKKGLDSHYLRLDGSTKPLDRAILLKEFDSNDNYKLFILSTRAGGLGLNLQAADTVIIFDSDWNPQADIQATNRAHRIGQTKDVLIIRFLTTNTVEEKVVRCAAKKLEMESKVLEEGKFTFTNASTSFRRKDVIRFQELLENTFSTEEEQSPEEYLSHVQELICRDKSELETLQKLAASSKGSRRSRRLSRGGSFSLDTDRSLPLWFQKAQILEPSKLEYDEFGSKHLRRRGGDRPNYDIDQLDATIDKLD